MGLLEELQNTEVKYNEKLIANLISSNKRRGEVGPKTKKIIFFMMKKIVLKGVYQFMSTQTRRKNETPYEGEDIAIEIYLVMENCIRNFDPKLKKNFYLYFNSAVSRRISRMSNYKSTFDPDYRKMSLDKEYGTGEEAVTLKDFISSEECENLGGTDIGDFDDLFFMGFSQIDKQIMLSIYNKETNEQMSQKYGLSRAQLRDKIQAIKEELGQRQEN